MLARALLLLPVLLAAAPALADDIKCEGAFAADSSEARLIEIFGRDHVVTGEVDGPEGSTIIATTVFPNDPDKRMLFGWWDETAYAELSYAELTKADTVAGVHHGMTVKELDALNGEPFIMTGFWWDYGGYTGFQSGRLSDLPGGCHLSLYLQPSVTAPEGLDIDSITGDVEVQSGNPLLEQLAVKVDAITIGYPFPEDLSGGEDEPAN